MSWVDKRLPWKTDEGVMVSATENIVQKITAGLNIAALTTACVLAVPFMGLGSEPFSGLQVEIVLQWLIVMLAINTGQFFIILQLRARRRMMEDRATHDALTGVYNESCFFELIQEETRRAGRYHYSLALCVVDIDDFTAFNERFGSELSNELLKRFADFLKSTIRVTDSIARFEDDAFLILLPHTDVVRAAKFLARVMDLVNEQFDIGFSAGVTGYRTGESRDDFLKRTQSALSEAKASGKKRIRCMIGENDAQTIQNI